VQFKSAFLRIIIFLFFGFVGYQIQRYFYETKLQQPPPQIELSTEKNFFISLENDEKKIYHLIDVVNDPMCSPCHYMKTEFIKADSNLECPKFTGGLDGTEAPK